ADAVRQGNEARLRALVGLLELCLERGGLQLRRALLVGQAETWVKAQQGGVLAQKRDAETVDGADLRAAQQRALPATARGGFALGPGGQLGEVFANLAAQLLGGGAGEGDDEEAVHVGGVLRVQYVAHKALYQHPGLAAARGGGDEYFPAPVGYGQGLARR